MTGFIDVHAHFLTGSYVAQARAAGHDVLDGMPAWPDWSAAAHRVGVLLRRTSLHRTDCCQTGVKGRFA